MQFRSATSHHASTMACGKVNRGIAQKIFLCLFLGSVSGSLYPSNTTAEIDETVRYSFDGDNTPDYMVYEAVLNMLFNRRGAADVPNIELVIGAINLKYNDQQGHWYHPRPPPHSRAAALSLLHQLENDYKQLQAMNIQAKLIICPRETQLGDADEVFAAYEQYQDAQWDNLRTLLEETHETIGEELSTGLHRWLQRLKSGHFSIRYDAKKRWEGKESEFELLIERLCNTW